jgi:hypothetical protein
MMRAKDSVAILHHLLNNGGLEEDQSRPEQELLLPENIRKAWLVNLQRAVAATCLVLHATNEKSLSLDQQASFYLHACNNVVASTLLNQSWYKEAKAMAFGRIGEFLLNQSWETPNAETCVLACDCLFYAIKTCPSGYLYDPPHILNLRSLLKKGQTDLVGIYNREQTTVGARYHPRARITGPPTPEFPPTQLPQWYTDPVDIIKSTDNIIDLA